MSVPKQENILQLIDTLKQYCTSYIPCNMLEVQRLNYSIFEVKLFTAVNGDATGFSCDLL